MSLRLSWVAALASLAVLSSLQGCTSGPSPEPLEIGWVRQASESAEWQALPVVPYPGTVDAAVYLSGSRRVLAINEGTWLGDGSTWTRVVETNPFVRDASAPLVYDSRRDRVVRFGGGGGCVQTSGCRVAVPCYECAYEAATWEWDGSTWTQVETDVAPDPRDGHAMTYHAASGQVLLYGGEQCTFTDAPLASPWCTGFADTWAYDGSQWTQLDDGSKAPGSTGAGLSLTYDSGRARSVLSGAASTWEWTGSAWQAHGSFPAVGTGFQTDYDPTSAKVVLFGGSGHTTNDCDSINRDVYRYDGGAWSVFPTNRPRPPGFCYAGTSPFVWDAAHGSGLLLAGSTYWELSGTTWDEKYPAGYTPSLDGVGADPVRARLVGFGWESLGRDTDPDAQVPRTWEWDGIVWTRQPVSSGPPKFKSFSLAYGGGAVIFFGGYDYVGSTETPRAETWGWNGSDWIKKSPSVSPPPRWSAGTAWDPKRQRLVLFGGETDFHGKQLDDTWEWDGATWKEIKPATRPQARRNAAMAFDSRANKVVLVGGYTNCLAPPACAAGWLADTWEWDGTTWNKRVPATPLTKTDNPSLVDYPERGRLVLAAGNYAGGGTWEWDGSDWHSITTTSTPSATLYHDPVRKGVLAYGSSGLFAYVRPGQTCSDATECSSGHCVDGVCCATACGSCETCNAPGSAGNCTKVTNAEDPDTCSGNESCDPGGQCKGALGVACSGDAKCASGHCVDGACCGAAQCGSCQACNRGGGVCAAVAGADDLDSCKGQSTCDANAVCRRVDGEDCTTVEDCASGGCRDGKCCGGDDCKLPPGAACSASSQCRGGGSCTDGVCCDRPCHGSCERCDQAGHEGTCLPTNETPRGVHPSCGSDPVCGGACDGTSSDCVYAATGTACGAVCQSGAATESACDGEGSCVASAPEDCGAFACAGGKCKTACRTNADCAAGAVCDAQSGRCSTARRACVDESALREPDGTRTPCWPYQCISDSTGDRCADQCKEDADCAEGLECGFGSCVKPGQAPRAVDTSSGCTVNGRVNRPGHAGAILGVVTLSMLAVLRRRRARMGAALAAVTGLGPAACASAEAPSHPALHDVARVGAVAQASGQEVGRFSEWSRGATPPSPTGMYWDPTAQRITVAGNSLAASTQGMWRWDGSSWSRASSTAGTVGAYDRSRKIAVAVISGYCDFSGSCCNASPPCCDAFACPQVCWACSYGEFGGHSTNEWNGTPSGWKIGSDYYTQVPLGGFDLAYDETGARLLLFGGSHCEGPPSGTLDCAYSAALQQWDGSRWNDVGTDGPAPRHGHRMTWDASRHLVVLYGGGTESTPETTTWELDGDTWQENTTPGPGPRYDAGFTYDRAKKVSLLFGGSTGPEYGGSGWNADLWKYDGTTWKAVARTTPWPPAGTGSPLFAYDESRHVSVLVPDGNADDVWEYDGAAFKVLHPSGFPSRYPEWAVATDPQRSRTVLLGFDGYGGAHTWEWDGTRWTERSPAASPPARSAPALGYAGSGRILLYGGVSNGSAISAPWVWDGTAWTKAPSIGSPPMASANIAWDAARSRAVIFGDGRTLEWDGTSVVDRTPSSESIGASGPLAYDPSVAHVVRWSSGHVSDWSGSKWTDRASAAAIVADRTRLAFDERRQRLVLVGFSASSFGPDKVSVWEWIQGDFQQVTLVNAPTVADSTRASVVYDPSRAGVALHADGSAWDYQRPGLPCTTDSDCSTGQCVDGVCCATPCPGPCRSCATIEQPGVCAPVLDAQDPDTCTGDQTCDASGSCKQRNGVVSGEDTSCASGHRVDGVCCERQACDPCQACNVPGTEGTCEPVKNGTDLDTCTGDSACDGEARCRHKDGRACQVGDDCVSGACHGGVCCSGADCKAADGDPCFGDGDCRHGHCVDGVCCDSPCNESCERCDVEGAVGKCSAAPKDTVPEGLHPACEGDPAVCGGTCDGKSRACRYVAKGTSCGQSCTDGVESVATCDGEGACLARERHCAPFTCGKDGCNTTCSPDVPCADGYVCTPDGTCATGSVQCKDDVTLASSDGTVVSCFPHRCAIDRCVDPCTTDAHCAEGYACEAGKCVSTAVADAGTAVAPAKRDSDGGCSVGGGKRPGAGALAVSLAMLVLRRARRRSSKGGRS